MTSTVIDVGCARYGGDYSIERLVEMFHPATLYGFDPAEPLGGSRDVDGTAVFVNLASVGSCAWIYDGEVRFILDGLNSQVGSAEHWPLVPCFDLAKFIDELPVGPIILKLDCEGSEYPLLDHLLATNVDIRLERLLVEWHPVGAWERKRAKILRGLTCEVEEWRW